MSVMKNKETISDSKDCEKIKVTLALMTELEKGEDSAREEGWISADEVEKTLGIPSMRMMNLNMNWD